MNVDYFRVTPDNCPTGADQTAPTTTATAAPAAPNGTDGWYTSDVNVTLAGNDGANGSGIDKIEYKRRRRRVRHLQRPGRRHDGRHAHDRVPLDRQGRQRRGHQVADGQGRQGGAGDDRRRSPADRARHTVPVDAHADRDRPDLRASPRASTRSTTASPFGAFGAPSLTSAAGLGRLRPGQQAGLHGPRRLLDRLPLDSTPPATSRPSRRSRSRSRPRTTITCPGHDRRRWTRRARVRAGRTPAPVTVKFSATDPAPGGRRRQTVNVNAAGTAWDAGDAEPQRRRHGHVELPGRRITSRTTCGSSPPGGNPRPGSPDRSRSARSSSRAARPVSKTFTTRRRVDVLLQPARVATPSGAWTAWPARSTSRRATGRRRALRRRLHRVPRQDRRHPG